MAPMDGVRRVYDKPPIQEALCHFTFSEPLNWNMATPGLIYQQIRDQYPAPPEQQEQLQATVGVVSKEDETAGFTLNRGPVRAVFKDSSGNRLLLLDSKSFSVNSLNKYEGWESLSARAADICEALTNSDLVQPVRRVAIRYVNRVVIPIRDQEIDLQDYFNIPLNSFQSEKSAISAFILRTESALLSRDATAITTFGSVKDDDEEESGASFLLDLEVYRENLPGWTLADALLVANELKMIENTEFETLITPLTRRLFK